MPAFEQLASDYAALWDSAEITEAKARDVAATARRVLSGKERYKVVEAETGVPWFVVGLIHARESTCDFSTHLHNGDPLTRRTYHVPAGRPRAGQPPFSWEFSAKDALQLDGLTNVKRWTVERVAYELEKFNGWGYRGRCPSPYLWSGTNHYAGGKYVSDGKFSAAARDQQSGTLAVLKKMVELDVSLGAMLPREADPEVTSPKAAPKLRESRTIWGVIYIKAGAVLMTLADIFGGIVADAPEIIAQAETHQSLAERAAALLSINIPMIGLACIAAGVCLALYARVNAHLTGKVG